MTKNTINKNFKQSTIDYESNKLEIEKLKTTDKYNTLLGKVNSGNLSLTDFLDYDSNLLERVKLVLDTRVCSDRKFAETSESCSCSSFYYSMFLLVNLDRYFENIIKISTSNFTKSYKLTVSEFKNDSNNSSETFITTQLYDPSYNNTIEDTICYFMTLDNNKFITKVNSNYPLAIKKILKTNFNGEGSREVYNFINKESYKLYVEEGSNNIFIKPFSDIILQNLVKQNIIEMRKYCFSSFYRPSTSIDTNDHILINNKYYSYNEIKNSYTKVSINIPAYNYLISFTTDSNNTAIINYIVYNDNSNTAKYEVGKVESSFNYFIVPELNELQYNNATKYGVKLLREKKSESDNYIYIILFLLLLLLLFTSYFYIFYYTDDKIKEGRVLIS